MLFKKKFEEQTVNGVRMGNGTVAFRGVKLNVHCFFIDGVLLIRGPSRCNGFHAIFPTS